MEMLHMHAGNCGVTCHQEVPECSLSVLKLTKDDRSACIAITRQLKSIFC
jgi:hypothetical protein